jgi:DNA uptake protein ComE-like DNA-binding protein
MIQARTLALLAVTVLACGSAQAKMHDDDDVGQKISKTTSHNAPKPAQAKPAKPAAKKIKLVDINSASKTELKTLPGVGDKEADKIIAGRPYGSKAFLVTRNIIPAGLYDAIKANIIAKQK